MCARVLVVDDDPVNADLLGYLLRAFGHEPTLALGGEAAVLEARFQTPDLILCDIQMPEMDGFEFLRILRADARFFRTPVLGVTALAMVGDREKILAAGFDGYLTKPIAPETFIDQIEKFLPSGPPPERSRQPIAAAPAAEGAPPPVLSSRGFVLVVDDIAANVELLRHLITSLGLEVRSASNVSDALRIAREVKPMMIVSDIHMPELDGLHFLGEARSDPSLRDVPFLLISSSVPSEEDKRRASAAGVNEMLIRPLDPEAILSTFAKWMRREEEQ